MRKEGREEDRKKGRKEDRLFFVSVFAIVCIAYASSPDGFPAGSNPRSPGAEAIE